MWSLGKTLGYTILQLAKSVEANGVWKVNLNISLRTIFLAEISKNSVKIQRNLNNPHKALFSLIVFFLQGLWSVGTTGKLIILLPT